MDDTQIEVQAALKEVGPVQILDAALLLESLEYDIHLLQQLKARVEAGESGPLGIKACQLRDIQAQYSKSEKGSIRTLTQVGPAVTKIIVLDYNNAGQVIK